MDFYTFSQFLRRGGERGSPESLEMHYFLTFRFYFSGGVGSVGSPESLKMRKDFMHFHNLFGEVGNVGTPESWKISDFHTFSMTSSVEPEAWISMHFL